MLLHGGAKKKSKEKKILKKRLKGRRGRKQKKGWRLWPSQCSGVDREKLLGRAAPGRHLIAGLHDVKVSNARGEGREPAKVAGGEEGGTKSALPAKLPRGGRSWDSVTWRSPVTSGRAVWVE